MFTHFGNFCFGSVFALAVLEVRASKLLPCVRTFRSVDTHHRSMKMSLLSVHRNPCQSGVLCRACHLFLPLLDLPLPFVPFLDKASTSFGVQTFLHDLDSATELVSISLREKSRAALLVTGSADQAQLSVSFENGVSRLPHDLPCSSPV